MAELPQSCDLSNATGAPRRLSLEGVTIARQTLGREAERIVAQRLRHQGWDIVAHNVRIPGVRGELDLIGLDGPALVFVEVKARRAGSAYGPETPAMAVDARKQARIRALASGWLRERGYEVPRHHDLRFDVVGLRLDHHGQVTEYEHLRAAF